MHRLGAAFRIVGDAVDIDGDVPHDLREALPRDLLRQYLGAAQVDDEAIAFLGKLGVSAVLIEDIASAKAAMDDLSDSEIIGIDIETSPPNARPDPVRINADGKIAVRQPKPSSDGLDPHRAEIQCLQLYAGTDMAFVFRGAALRYVMDSTWLREQHLVAHNAAFEIAFLRHHSAPPEGVNAQYPVECTLQCAGLLYGCWHRSLAETSKNALGMNRPRGCRSAPGRRRSSVPAACIRCK